MKTTVNNNLKIDTVFALMVFCVFAISVFLVLILSASTYRNTVDAATYGQNERIALSYIRTKVRQADSDGAVRAEDFHGAPSLAISQFIGNEEFITRIYHYNGWLREIFHEAVLDFLPGDGIPMLQVDTLSFNMVDGLLTVTTDYGSMTIFLRSFQRGVATR